MFNIEKLHNIKYFKQKTLSRGELLFDEGNIDDNLYFIVSGKLSIEKWTTQEKLSKQQLAIIKSGDFLGEGSLKKSKEKEVSIKALEETKLIYIDTQKDFLNFIKDYPELSKDTLVEIISITNQRTLDANKYITSVYEINKSINKVQNINYIEIFKILNKINIILEGKYILYIEANSINPNFLTLKYDSREEGKMKNILVEKGHYKLEDIGIKKDEKIIVKEIKIANEHLCNIIVGKNTNFSQNEKRIFLALINSMSGILKQRKILAEERDKNFND